MLDCFARLAVLFILTEFIFVKKKYNSFDLMGRKIGLKPKIIEKKKREYIELAILMCSRLYSIIVFVVFVVIY